MTGRILVHHGVKGMKWGRRKNDSVGQGGKTKKINTGLSDHDTANYIKSKPLDKMSNDEIEFLLRRQRLEKSYHELNPPQVSRGKKIVAGVAAVGATALAAVTKADQVYNAYKKIIKIDDEFKISQNVSELFRKK